MYKAIDIHSKRDVIILDPVWTRRNIDALREKDRGDALCCPGCKEPVRVKAGEKRRWHFAHKDLSDCSLRNESPEILEARGLLYTWLQTKFGEKATVEKSIPGIPMLFDCYVDTGDGRKIGYWILEKGLRERDSIIYALAEFDIRIVSIFLHKVLNRDNKNRNAVHLTPTERAFSFTSEYNRLYSPYDRGLVYLDETNGKIVTLRGLHCVHQPQKYEFDKMLSNDLSQILVKKDTGELIHPGEYKLFCAWQKQKIEEEKLRKIAEKKEQERRRRQEEQQQVLFEEIKRKAALQRSRNSDFFDDHPPKARISSINNMLKGSKTVREDIFLMDQEPYPCEICGTVTKEWISLDTRNKTCVCSRECSKVKRSMGQR